MIELRIFVSSPGDVRDERRIAGRVLERLALKWGRRVRVTPVFWEHEPLAADTTYQAQITPPEECDAVVVILWSRLGTRLPADITRPDGSRYDSGTEYELERALAAHDEHGRPEVLVYHKRKPASARLTTRGDLEERLRQKQRLDETIDRLFRHPDGSAARAKHSFEEPERFEELLRSHLDRLIARRLEQEEDGGEAREGEGAGGAARTSRWEGSPFRGLSVFQPEDASIFCGRSGRIRQVLDALREQELAGRPFVVVVGASGSGKSSLVRAGVLPRLTVPGSIGEVAFWRRAIWVPGTSADPFDGLARALLAEGALPELVASGTGAADLAADLRERPGAAVSRLRLGLESAARAELRRAGAGAGPEPEAGLVLLVDQVEELFSPSAFGAEDVKRIDAVLATLAGSGLVRILATLRSDFYDRFAGLPELMRLKEGAGQYDLPAPDPEEIGRMIREPADIAGLRWEREPESGRRLDDVVRDDAVADPGALPLLEFTLDELYHRSEDGRLTFAAYRALGGIEGALAHRADQVFAGLSAEARSALDPVLLALVRPSPDPDAPPSRRRAPRADFDGIPGGGELVDTFVRERLLTVDRGDDGGARVSVAHEALLRAWPRAVDWRARHAGQLATRARVESQAATWTAEGEAPGFLLPPGSLLDDARALLGTPGAPLGPAEERLVRASAEAADERRRKGALRKRLAVAAIVVLALASLLVWDLFLREHVGHFNALRFRDGVPEGVGRVPEEHRAARSWTYAVTRRGRLGRVLRMEAVDSRGAPSYLHDFEGFLSRYASGAATDLLDPRQTIGRETAWELDYEGGRVSRLSALDRAGTTIYELEYKGRSGRRDGKRQLTAEYSLDGVAVPQAESGASVVKTLWREDGLLEEVWYLDANGDRRPDRNLSWGTRVEAFDEAGMPARIASLGRGGEPAPNRDGWTFAQATWRDGLLTRVELFDADDRPVITRNGFARVEREMDEHGNVTEERYADEQGRPMPGVAVSRNEYDGAGRLVRNLLLGADRQPTTGPNGAYGTGLVFDDEGVLERIVLLGPDGETLDDPGFRYAGLGIEWAERREGDTASRGPARITYLDAAGEPVRLGLEGVYPGYASEAYQYDRRGNLVEVRYLDEEGRTVAPFGSYARVLKSYDGRNRLVIQRYQDARGLPARDITGCAAWRISYDPYGKPERRECLGTEDQPTVGLLGAVWRTHYDARGLPDEDLFLGVDERPMSAGLGCWIGDLRDQPPGKSDLDRLAELVVGRLLELAAGNPVPLAPGCSRVDVAYDARGDVDRIEYRDAPDRPLHFANGCARVRIGHDFRGREIARTCLDDSGVPAPARTGWARVRVDYEGGIPRETYWDAADRPLTVHAQGLDTFGMLLAAGAGAAAPEPDPDTFRLAAQGSPAPPAASAPPTSAPAAPPPLQANAPTSAPVPATPPPADQEAAALEIERLADRLRGEYDDHLDALLDASDRDKAEGEKRIEALLEELEDAAGALHDAAEEWAEDWEKPSQVARIRQEYAAGKGEVRRLAGEIAALAGSHPLGAAASATLAEIRRRVSALP